MDATVGFININQNKIIKIFSVVSVALMPPTLLASIWGMNFEYMPELRSSVGYPFAICMMLVSALIPLIYFRKKGWMK
jgi:magnesium transporter